MIPDWAYAAAIGALLTVIGILWKLHLDDDKRRDDDFERLQGVASQSSAGVGELAPAVRELARTVAQLDRSTTERLDEMRSAFAERLRDLRDEVRGK